MHGHTILKDCSVLIWLIVLVFCPCYCYLYYFPDIIGGTFQWRSLHGVSWCRYDLVLHALEWKGVRHVVFHVPFILFYRFSPHWPLCSNAAYVNLLNYGFFSDITVCCLILTKCSVLLGYGVASVGNRIPTFRVNVVPKSWRSKCL